MTAIKVLSIELKPTSSGKQRWSVKTEQGTMSCWDEALVKQLPVGEAVEVEIAEKDGFKNIKKVLPGVVVTSEHIPAKSYKPMDTTSMYVSYAKDLFCCIYPVAVKQTPLTEEGLMKQCCDLIKYAKGVLENGSNS